VKYWVTGCSKSFFIFIGKINAHSVSPTYIHYEYPKRINNIMGGDCTKNKPTKKVFHLEKKESGGLFLICRRASRGNHTTHMIPQHWNVPVPSHRRFFKETVSWDFRFMDFFINQLPLGP
jgi:hypothetical protein